MGQMAVGIMYGVEAPKKLPKTLGDDEPIYDLICRWEKAAKVRWNSPGLKVVQERKGSKDLVGVWVAVGGSGEDGAAYFVDHAVRLDKLRGYFGQNIGKAAALFQRFSAYCLNSEGVRLGTPRLWITPCEVA